MAIQSFGDKATEVFFLTGIIDSKHGWVSIRKIVLKKLDILHKANVLYDLRFPSGNRLEALKGDLTGYFSIRVNNQWRVIFRWTLKGPTNVKVVDYH